LHDARTSLNDPCTFRLAVKLHRTGLAAETAEKVKKAEADAQGGGRLRPGLVVGHKEGLVTGYCFKLCAT
jgi:hypothetical protein